MLGEVISEQVAEALLETNAPLQLSAPLAVTVLLTEQESEGAVKAEVKLAVAPGARVATENTVDGDDWALTTVTLFKATLPELRTVPV